jgi:hypothetical protein
MTPACIISASLNCSMKYRHCRMLHDCR